MAHSGFLQEEPWAAGFRGTAEESRAASTATSVLGADSKLLLTRDSGAQTGWVNSVGDRLHPDSSSGPPPAPVLSWQQGGGAVERWLLCCWKLPER